MRDTEDINKGTNIQMKKISGKQKKGEEKIFEGIKRIRFPELEREGGKEGWLSSDKKDPQKSQGRDKEKPTTHIKVKCKTTKGKEKSKTFLEMGKERSPNKWRIRLHHIFQQQFWIWIENTFVSSKVWRKRT